MRTTKEKTDTIAVNIPKELYVLLCACLVEGEARKHTSAPYEATAVRKLRRAWAARGKALGLPEAATQELSH